MHQPLIVGYVAGRFERKVILPIASLVLSAMLTLAGVLWWSSAAYDDAALRDEQRLLETALNARLEREAEMLFDYAFWDEAYQQLHLTPDLAWARENIAGWAHQRLGVAMTFVLDPQGRVWLGEAEGMPVESDAQQALGPAAWDHVNAVRRSPPDRPRAIFAAVGGQLAVVTAAPVGTHTDSMPHQPGPPSTVVQVNLLDAHDLAELARTYLLPDLRLAGTPASTGPHYVIADGEGRPVATLTWRTAAPGRDLLARVLPVFGLAALGLCVLTWVVLRHARDAAATIAVSEERASHDPLTGLPNRRLLDHRVAAAFDRPSTDTPVALLYLDLDGFKPINDGLGHEAGDELLREVARRLRAVARASDTVARVGGDEFVVMQLGGAQPAGAARLAEAIIAALGCPAQLGSFEVRIGVSIGIAVAAADVPTPRELIRRADVALYAAKAAGRGTYRFFGADERPTGTPAQSEAADPEAVVA